MTHTPTDSLAPDAELTLLRGIDAATGSGVITIDASGRIIHVNAAFCRMVGWSRKDLLGAEAPFAFWPEEDYAFLHQRLGVALEGGIPPEGLEVTFKRCNGHRFPARLMVVPLLLDGKGNGWVTTVIDLSLERAQAQALRLSNERLEMAQEGGHVGIWDLDLLTNESYWSRETARIYGMSDATIVDYSAWRELVPAEELARIDAVLKDEIAHKKPFEIEFPVRIANGELRWILSKGKAAYDAEGHPIRMFGINLDVTERKRADEALRALAQTLEAKVAERTAQLTAAVAAKSEFLAHMSHEIRTPMNAVLGLTQLLQRERLTAEQREVVGTMAEAGQSLLRIINDILDFSKIEAGQLRVERQPYDLGAVLARTEQLLRDAALKKGIELRIAQPPTGMRTILGDSLRLEQVLLNLIGNAIKFTAQGVVELRVDARYRTPKEGGLRFEVRDTGIGIPPSAFPTLFDPFVQVGSESSRQYGGTGLGLPICKRLVELMDGRIGVDSEPGMGSTFWFELPFVSNGDAATSKGTGTHAVAPGPSLTGLRVLAADDNRVNLLILEKFLRKEGVIVTLAADGQQALQILRALPGAFDLVLMDLRMPVMDGLTATRAIRADPALARIPVLALTAGVMPEERTKALAAGVDDFLTKPLDLQHMVRTLAAIRSKRPPSH